MPPKGSFPVRKPEGSFPSESFDVFDAYEPFNQGKPKTNISLTKSIKMMNSCLKDTQRAIHPASSGYKSLFANEDNDSLPLLEHTESRTEETFDFFGVVVSSA